MEGCGEFIQQQPFKGLGEQDTACVKEHGTGGVQAVVGELVGCEVVGQDDGVGQYGMSEACETQVTKQQLCTGVKG